MCVIRAILGAAIIAICGVGAVLAQTDRTGDILLVVDLQTDYTPREDFAALRVRVVERDTGVLARDSGLIQPFRSFDPPGNLPLAQWENLYRDDFNVFLDVYDDFGRVATTLQRRVNIGEERNRGITFVHRRPGAVRMETALLVDRDRDGVLSYGDIARLSVNAEVEGTEGSTYRDDFAQGNILCWGTVTTNFGQVTTGNGEGDGRVAVQVPRRREEGRLRITYDVIVAPNFVMQGEVAYRGGTALGPSLSDDPLTARARDPLNRPVRPDAVATCPNRVQLDPDVIEKIQRRDDLPAVRPLRFPDLMEIAPASKG
jgi:hypothetical protein